MPRRRCGFCVASWRHGCCCSVWLLTLRPVRARGCAPCRGCASGGGRTLRRTRRGTSAGAPGRPCPGGCRGSRCLHSEATRRTVGSSSLGLSLRRAVAFRSGAARGRSPGRPGRRSRTHPSVMMRRPPLDAAGDERGRARRWMHQAVLLRSGTGPCPSACSTRSATLAEYLPAGSAARRAIRPLPADGRPRRSPPSRLACPGPAAPVLDCSCVKYRPGCLGGPDSPVDCCRYWVDTLSLAVVNSEVSMAVTR